MNINLIHPYLTYLLYFVILTGFASWVGNFIKNKSSAILIALSISNILSLIGFSIINALFLVFVFSAGFFLNFDFLVNVIWIFVYIYCAGEMKAFRRHGQGEYIWYSGKTFKGEWIEGKSVR